MRLGTKRVAIGGAIAAALAGGVVLLTSGAEPLPQVTFSTSPYTHNMSIGGCVYSGTFCVHTQQWGAYAIDATKATWTVNSGMVSPITSKAGGYQPAALTTCGGDFFSSAGAVAASPSEPKWVVSSIGSLGSHAGCGKPTYLVQVYRLSSGGLSYAGQADVNALGGGGDIIIGDTAYIEKSNGTWVPVDLNSCSPTGCTAAEAVGSLPPHTPQQDIGGYTYTLTLGDPYPPNLMLVRSGDVPTPPGPTAIPPTAAPPTPVAANPYAKHIEALARAGITGGCGGGNFCPKAYLTREQAAVWFANAFKYQLLACDQPQRFADVPCE